MAAAMASSSAISALSVRMAVGCVWGVDVMAVPFEDGGDVRLPSVYIDIR